MSRGSFPLRLPLSLWMALRASAERAGVSLNSWIIEAIRARLVASEEAQAPFSEDEELLP